MQEKFSYGQRMARLYAMNKNGPMETLESTPMATLNICKKAFNQQLCKPNQDCCAGFPCAPKHNHVCEGYKSSPPPCIPNEGCHACDTNPSYRTKAFSANPRTFNVPETMNPNLIKIAGGSPEKFCGKIDNSKYGNYGTSMLQPVETFCPGASNARINGATMDMGWASGTMDAICRRGAQPFNPIRYGKYKA